MGRVCICVCVCVYRGVIVVVCDVRESVPSRRRGRVRMGAGGAREKQEPHLGCKEKYELILLNQ